MPAFQMSRYTKKWRPQVVKKAVMAELMENAEIVGKFVEEEARRRLYAIQDPEWGERYRRLIVGQRLTFVVERERNAVVITVGVKGGEKGRYYGFYIEMGSKTSPAHPYLRPAVFDNAREIVALLGGQ
jgi:hypothetical protein